MATDAAHIARGIVGQLEKAWNDADGPAFGRPFTSDADFVDIRGEHHRGQEAISEGHHGIFATVYRGSRIRYEVTHARALGDGVLLVHATGELDAPSGPLAGKHSAVQSLVLVREADEWKIASFHNTLVAAGQKGGAGRADASSS